MGRRKTNSIKGEELQSFVSVQNWLSSIGQRAKSKGKEGLTIGAKRQRLGRMLEYTKFTGLNPEQLLEEGKQDSNKAGQRLSDFFDARVKDGIDWNTACTNLSYLRGFYTHNDVRFSKRWILPSRKTSAVKKTDEKVPVYTYDDEGNATLDKNLLQSFIRNLNFRDQTIALCLLSSGADSADLLALNVEFVKDGMGKLCMRKRFFLKADRQKDGLPFKTLFSVEATEFIRRYVEQERSDAKNNEPLFAKKYTTRERPEPKTDQFVTQYFIEEKGRKVIEYRIVERLTVAALQFNFKVTSEKMGYKEDSSNPFRPKRFRSLFRVACDKGKVPDGISYAMMGHKDNVHNSYLEKDDGTFIHEYTKLEPFVTVFGININETEIVTQIQDDMKELKVQTFDKTAELEKELKEIKGYFEMLVQAIKVEDIGQFKEWLENRRRAEFDKADKEQCAEINKSS